MDIVRFMGGLGNQMFQYAFYLELESRNRMVEASLGEYPNRTRGYRPLLVDEIFLGVRLNVVKEEEYNRIYDKWRDIKSSPKKLDKFLDEKNLSDRFVFEDLNAYKYDERVFQCSDCTYIGYWQSERYFWNVRELVRKAYQFSNIDNDLKRIGESYRGLVSVHVRRGDYLKNRAIQVCDARYYIESMELIKSIIGDVEFVVFSDDIEWVTEFFREYNSVIINNRDVFDKYEDWYDMYLMSKCRANIISNSTFSWWGAWLNDNYKKIVISPKKWINDSSVHEEGPIQDGVQWICL